MAARDKTEDSPIADFEKSLKDLEGLVERLERGEHSLEESLRCFEEGIALSRRCQAALTAAEQRVRVLVEQEGLETAELAEFGDRDDVTQAAGD